MRRHSGQEFEIIYELPGLLKISDGQPGFWLEVPVRDFQKDENNG